METQNEGGSFWGPYIFGQIVGAAIVLGPFVTSGVKDANRYKVPECDRQKATVTYDMNNDGLEDTVLNDGTVKVKQQDGSYMTLREMRNKEVEAVRQKYELVKDPNSGTYHTKGLVRALE